MILCGSISAWIENNIISSTGYFGRVSQKITLKELPLRQSNQLLDAVGFKGSNFERFLILSLTGGVPWYIEQINHKYSAADNIKRLCFEPEALMVEEHDHIFHDLFGRRSKVYQQITEFLANGAAEYKTISDAIDYPSGGALSTYLDELRVSGYISRDFSWSIKTGKESRIFTYHLSDNYLRFYYKYIAPKVNQIENLVLNNRTLIHKKLRIHPEDIVADNPYYQRQSSRHKDCQIDYLIQLRFNTLYACEVKFSQRAISSSVIKEMQEKLAHFAVPRGYSCVPVLIHINSVTDNLKNAGYFEFIDFSEFFNSGL